MHNCRVLKSYFCGSSSPIFLEIYIGYPLVMSKIPIEAMAIEIEDLTIGKWGFHGIYS
jgi:hypothetical protein